MAQRPPRRHADQMFRYPDQAAGRPADPAAQLYLRHAHHARRHVRALFEDDKGQSGLELLRDRCQPFAERHGAGSVDGAAAEDRCISGEPVARMSTAISGTALTALITARPTATTMPRRRASAALSRRKITGRLTAAVAHVRTPIYPTGSSWSIVAISRRAMTERA